jgi:hypothetical protein
MQVVMDWWGWSSPLYRTERATTCVECASVVRVRRSSQIWSVAIQRRWRTHIIRREGGTNMSISGGVQHPQRHGLFTSHGACASARMFLCHQGLELLLLLLLLHACRMSTAGCSFCGVMHWFKKEQAESCSFAFGEWHGRSSD